MTDDSEYNDVNPENDTPEEASTDSSADDKQDDMLARLVAENTDLKDRLLRAVAETENLRRRTDREKADAANYAITSFARDLLGVGDNLRRALDSIPADADLGEHARTLVDGIKMTERDLINMLERHNIKRIDPMGEKFNHDRHQALFEVPDTGEEDGTIVQVMQTGYIIKDRLLRPAMVGVARGGKETAPAGHVDTKA